MIVIATAVFGILLGLVTARRHGGNTKDRLQYAASFGIAFTILGFILSIVVERLVT